MSLISRFTTYAFAGALGTTVHYLTLLVLVNAFLVHSVLASVGGSIAGAVVNYMLSYHWVFRSKRRHTETATKFFVIAGTGLVLNAIIMYSMVTLAEVHYLISQIAATGVVLMFTFSGNHFWTFAHGHPKGSRTSSDS